MSLRPDETDLVGKWCKDGNRVVADEVELRIGELIAHELKKVAVNPDSGAWEVLFRDTHDGRYWELTYPQGEMHGGGPRRLTSLSPTAALAKYRLSNSEE
jgi:Immunity protein 27